MREVNNVKLVKKNGNALIIMSVILSIGIILSSAIVAMYISKGKVQNTISVTGSAKKQIKSDLVTWKGRFTVQSDQLAGASNILSDNAKKVKSYLISKGIPEKDIVLSSVNTETLYNRDYGYSNRIEGYRLSQSVEISSKDVEKITNLSRESSELINQGINFQSDPPQYFYTEIAKLKVSMLGDATADAKVRAQQIAKSTDAKIGRVRSANMGVFQITPLYSTDVSDYGVNDTSSLDKEITAVVNCSFEIK